MITEKKHTAAVIHFLLLSTSILKSSNLKQFLLVGKSSSYNQKFNCDRNRKQFLFLKNDGCSSMQEVVLHQSVNDIFFFFKIVVISIK